MRNSQRLLPAILLTLTGAGRIQAHFALLQPASAVATEDGGKGAGPCGAGPASNIVTEAQGGHPIAIRLNEFVFHPGHYRIALSVLSRSELPADPDVVADRFGNSISAKIQTPARVPVLGDGVFSHTSPPTADFQTTLTLPNLNCEKCTLQLIEFMAAHGANVGGGFYYHHCAELKITADPNLPPADAAWPRAVTPSTTALPHIAAGAGWVTTLHLVNTSASSVSATVALRGDDGAPLNLPAPQAAVLKPNSITAISIGDPAGPPASGWAQVQGQGALSGYAVYRSTTAAGVAIEGVVPLQAQAQPSLTFPFDNTTGYATGLAVANPSTGSTEITVTLWDDAGNSLGSQLLTVAAGGHTAFLIHVQLPATTGKRGLIKLDAAAGGSFTGVSLRFNAAGAFVWLPPLL